MKRILISIFVFVLIFVSYQPKKTEAVTGAVARVVYGSVGERLVVGMAEKAGVKLATKEARQKAVERWNLELYEKIKEAEAIGKDYEAQELIRMQNMMANASTSSPELLPSGTNGYSKFVIGTAMFLTGADIVYDIYSNVKLAEEQNNSLEVMTDYTRGLATGEYLLKAGGTYVDTFEYTTTQDYTGWYQSDGSPIYGDVYTKGSRFYYLTTVAGSTGFYVVSFMKKTSGGVVSTVMSNTYSTTRMDDNITTKVTPITPNTFDLPDTINPLLDPLRSPGIQTLDESSPIEIPDTYPQEVEITIPDTADYPEIVEVPWNEPLMEVEPVGTPGTVPGSDIVAVPDTGPMPGTEPLPNADQTPTNTTPQDPESCARPWDFKNFKTLGNNFTTAFPFSLPWDIWRAMQAVFGGMTSDKPEWTFDLGANLGGGKEPTIITIPEFFDQWQGFAHSVLLITFDIGLIYAIRKWLGGAS